MLSGSSPLARGLLNRDPQDRIAGRIIPARAGFTYWKNPCGAFGTDHPRSRGVYYLLWLKVYTCCGSSPLARGLPRARRNATFPTRIIPARAGFTWSPISGRCRPADHPRSRGVYQFLIMAWHREYGSSPLARGLPVQVQRRQDHRRIIPARAGFTPAEGRCPWRRRDHPRSRGVYQRTMLRRSLRAGSSPLARGLPPHPAEQHCTGRIIPARAGFTPLR